MPRLLCTLLALLATLAVSHAQTPWNRYLEEAAARLQAQQQIPATGVTLVADGAAVATLVHGEDGKAAAGVLNTWLERMSGVRLPTAAEAPQGAAAIYLGEAAVAAGLALDDIVSETNEGIRIRSDGTRVLISAQSPAALTRAVGRFLEEAFGCRHLATTSWGPAYPTLATLRVRDLELSEKPGPIFRRIWGANGAFRDSQWTSWNGHGGRGLPMSHDWGFLSKADFEQHPEWFRMNEKGERVYGEWPNWGNEQVRQKFIEYALARSEGGTKSISLSPPDSYQFDHSPEAKQYDNPNVIVASTGWVSMTDRFIGVVNEAAKAVYAQGQDAVVSFYAYSDYTMPPTRPELQKLSPNLCIWIAPIRYSRYHPIGHPNSASRQELQGIIQGWAKAADMLGYRTYNYNLAEILTPFSKLSVWSQDMPWLRHQGCIGYNLESMDSWELSAPHLWQSIRLAYDPLQPTEPMIADFMVSAYGPAAATMMAYWMAIDDAWVNLQTEAGSIHPLPQVFTPELLARLDALMAEAATKTAAAPAHAARVEVAQRGLRRAHYWRSWFDAFNAGDLAKVTATYDEWLAFVEESKKLRNANDYELTYLRRFINGLIQSAVKAVQPEGEPARRVVKVLPDRWKYANGDYVSKLGADAQPFAVDFADQAWPTVATASSTLSAQGYPDYFGDMWYRTRVEVPAGTGRLFLHVGKADRKLTVYINGKVVNEEELEAFRGATVEITDAVKRGEVNQVTLKIRHVPLPELYLGGLVGPVWLVAGE